MKRRARLDYRRVIPYAVTGLFMAVTVGHVAGLVNRYDLQAGGLPLGWPYALGVDAGIVVCALFTRWQTTRKWAWTGYLLFVLASGLLNVAHIQPWLQGHDALGAWVYAVLPTLAISILGFLARQVDKLTRASYGIGGGAAEVTKSPAEPRKAAGDWVRVCGVCPDFTAHSPQAWAAHCKGAAHSANIAAQRERRAAEMDAELRATAAEHAQRGPKTEQMA